MQIDLGGSAPILIFGGPYSNLQATLAMREMAERMGVPPSRTICTGDVVAYCAEPEETVELIRAWGCHVIRGNCEESLAAGAPDCGCGFEEGSACNMLSQSWYPFADRAISAASRDWMGGLPDSLTFDLGGRRATVIHGGVHQRSRFIFASDPAEEKRKELDAADSDIIIAGHCGIPFIERIGEKLWFNPGVIGMPANDGTPDGWRGLIEPSPDGLNFSIRRLSYDAATSARHLREASSAPAYADALVTGLWPSLDVLPEAERAAAGSPLIESSLTLKA